MDESAAYLDRGSERFRQVYVELAEIVREVFPSAEAAFAYKMPGFRIKVTRREVKEWKGTIDPNYLQLFLVERQQGITLHVWNPADYYGLDKRKEELTRAGFKVMRGCLQWNKKQVYPLETVQVLLESIKLQFIARD